MNLADWVGRTQTTEDQITATPIAALSATLDRDAARPAAGTPVPPLWHWLYFVSLSRWSEIGPDGHAERGASCRRWRCRGACGPAAGRGLTAAARRRSIARVDGSTNVNEKRGAAGRWSSSRCGTRSRRRRRPALTEEHDIVYREPPSPGRAPPPQAAPAPRVGAEIVPDGAAVPLFRADFNATASTTITVRDRAEGYPGLVVHGPLIATLLLDLLRWQLPMHRRRFAFRAVRPLFDLHPFTVCGAPLADGKTFHLWAKDHEGWLTMDATARID